MPAYSFKRQFAAPIRAGTKAQTIRNNRRRNPVTGDPLQLYFGMRTRQCQLIGRAVCLFTRSIAINVDSNAIYLGHSPVTALQDLDGFAQNDGFPGWREMRQFWLDNHGRELFNGVVIRWHRFEANPDWHDG